MDYDKLTDRNVAQLDFAAENLAKNIERQRGTLPLGKSLPGSPPSGGMARTGQDHATINDLNRPQDPTRQSGSTKDLLYQVMQTEAGLRAELADAKSEIEVLEAKLFQLENDLIEVKSTLGSENKLREFYEDTMRKIAELVVNGAKHKNDVATQ